MGTGKTLFLDTPFSLRVKIQEPLAPRTTLGVGGDADYYFETDDDHELIEILGYARGRHLPVFILGAGSNIVMADSGWPGLVVRYTCDNLIFHDSGDSTLVEASAGLNWDDLVVSSVSRGLGGMECLSGVPGLVGAAPVQNIGCYGQEVAETIALVEAIDVRNGTLSQFSNEECGFGYRQSRFKKDNGYLVTKVILNLRRTTSGIVRYDDVARALNAQNIDKPTLDDVRKIILNIRRHKSMVIDQEDPNSRSVGSFFVNPIVADNIAEDIERAASRLSLRRPIPRWHLDSRQVKLSAAWLIESSGFQRGYILGRVGISDNHILAIINRGGATAADVIALAGQIRRRVRDTFGISLEPEPSFIGFQKTASELLDE